MENKGPRLAPTDEAGWDDETRKLVDAAGHLNIFTTLAHHPKLLKRWMVFGSHVLFKSTLPERERELLILRTGYRCNCVYEFGQHTVVGTRAGLTGEEIHRLTVDGIDGWSDDDASLVVAADELVDDRCLSNPTWGALTARWDTKQVVDIVFAVGQYTLVCMALNTFGVEPEEGTPGWPT